MILCNIVIAIRSLLTTLTKLIKFVWARLQYEKRFHKAVIPAVFHRRIKKCCKCVFLDPATFKCRLCDCDVRLKAEWAEEECPDDPPRWEKIVPLKVR